MGVYLKAKYQKKSRQKITKLKREIDKFATIVEAFNTSSGRKLEYI